MCNFLRMKSNSKFEQDQPGNCLPTESPSTGWTDYIETESNLSRARNRTIGFDCQKEFTSNRRQCLAVETRTNVSKDKKDETYLDEETKTVGGHDFRIPIQIRNEEWHIRLKCNGKRERLAGKCSVVVLGQSVMGEVETVMDRIDSLTMELTKVPHAVFLPTETELNMENRHALSPALVWVSFR